VANWSVLKAHHKFDKATWDEAKTAAELPFASPKLAAMLDNIARLDADDMHRDGRMYKHFIFSDVKHGYGAKIVMGGLLTRGYRMAYDKRFQLDESGTDGMTAGILVSTQLFGEDVSSRFRKKVLKAFNRRPENIHGERMRIIVLDSGFKEGIDLFDVKYAHIFEPPATPGDRKQIVGRATRYCGQAGLRFEPNVGWPLNVYTYDSTIPEGARDVDGKLSDRLSGATSLFSAFLAHITMDRKRLRFADELTSLIQRNAADADLTTAVHGFGETQDGGRAAAKKKKARKPKAAKERPRIRAVPVIQPTPPPRIMDRAAMASWVSERFSRFKWPTPVVENACGDGSSATATATPKSVVATLTPTQEFVRHYFQPASAYKGLLLYHGTGTGKTCAAIATATTSFEREGYTILWVTRTTLRSDLWKNMFENVCSTVVKERKQPIPVAEAMANPMTYLSKNWMSPISYKMFTNLLAGKNELYRVLAKRNGEADVLRKTLVVIDEAHKLFSGDLPLQERPDAELLASRFHTSYAASGNDSARLLLLTATPWTNDAMDFIKLANLMRPEASALPTTFDAFAAEYLDAESGAFTDAGAARFGDDMAGYVSYLNRENDIRQFARPTYYNVDVPLSLDAATVGRARIEAMEGDKARLEAQHEEQKALYAAAATKLNAETAVWQKACGRVRDPVKREMCDAEVAQRVTYREEQFMDPLREAMEGHAQRISQKQAEIEATKEAMLRHPSRLLSQERALVDGCLATK